MNEMLNFINSIIARHDDCEKLLLVSSMTRGYQILENLSLELVSGFNLRPVTPFDLALEVIDDDLNERGLRVIADKQIIGMIDKILALLNNDAQQDIEVSSSVMFEKIIRLRLEETSVCDLQDKTTGRILNEYDLALEAGGFLDEAAVFDRAYSRLLNDSGQYADCILIMPEELRLSPIADRFIKLMRFEQAY